MQNAHVSDECRVPEGMRLNLTLGRKLTPYARIADGNELEGYVGADQQATRFYQLRRGKLGYACT